MQRIFFLTVALLVVACSDPSRNLYNGIQNKDAKRSPSERAMTPTPSYDEYKRTGRQAERITQDTTR